MVSSASSGVRITVTPGLSVMAPPGRRGHDRLGEDHEAAMLDGEPGLDAGVLAGDLWERVCGRGRRRGRSECSPWNGDRTVSGPRVRLWTEPPP
jgi:hypothetical protein